MVCRRGIVALRAGTPCTARDEGSELTGVSSTLRGFGFDPGRVISISRWLSVAPPPAAWTTHTRPYPNPPPGLLGTRGDRAVFAPSTTPAPPVVELRSTTGYWSGAHPGPKTKAAKRGDHPVNSDALTLGRPKYNGFNEFRIAPHPAAAGRLTPVPPSGPECVRPFVG
jgi:hypothetical protein